MFRSPSTLVLLLMLALLPGVALAQNTGKLAGRVTDAQTGETLIGANVFLPEISRGAATDIDGNYVILGIPVGAYTVQFSFAGLETSEISGVEISAGRTITLDAALEADNELETIVVEYERPLIQNDAIGVPKVVTGEDIQNLPVRGVQGVASIQAGVVSNDGSGTLNIRGGRGEEVDYYIDGVKVIGSTAIPQQAIAEQEMLIGTIPPQYGDATAGVISISTRSGGTSFFGAAEAITSTGLDSYGYNLGALTLGGPIVPGVVSFFLSGQGIYEEDSSPYALSTLRLNDGLYNSLQSSPQVVRLDRNVIDSYDGALFSDDDFFYVPFPTSFDTYSQGGPDSTSNRFLSTAALAEALGLDSGAGLLAQPLAAYDLISDPSLFSESRGKDDPSTQFVGSGNLEFRPVTGVNLRVGGTYAYDRDRGFSYDRSFFNRDRFTESTDNTYRGYVSLRQILSSTAFYQLQAEYSDRSFTSYPEEFGSDINNLISYGDIDAPQNEVVRRYFFVNDDGNLENLYRDGAIFPTSSLQGIGFSAPGTPSTAFRTFDDQLFRVSGSAQTQVGVHELSFGGEYEQRTQRSFSVSGAFARSFARYFDDGSTEDIGDDESVTAYDQLDFDDVGFNNPNRVRYYGYNYLGTEEADEDDIAQYVGVDTDNDGNADQFNRNIAPYQPLYYGGYVRDRVEYRDLVIDLGLRVDVFDNNTRALVDPFALKDIIRLDDLGNNPNTTIVRPDNVPSNIEGDFAVYASGNQVVGYRDLNGQFYNVNGEEVPVTDVNRLGSFALDGSGQLTDSAFEDYTPQLTVMPRVGVTFPVTNRALFFASYNVTSQRPSENAFATVQDFLYASESSGTLNNPGLKPEITTQYELGFRQRLNDRAALTLSGFYRTQRNKITLRNFNQAAPAGYTTYTNQDFTTTKGLEMALELRRTRNLAVNANYTLSFAEGTGSDSNSSNLLSFRTQSEIFPETLAPLSFDQRHNVNVSVDYRLGEDEGPMVAGVRPLAGFGFNVLGVFKSGNRYTQLNSASQESDFAQNIGLGITGSVNDVVIGTTSRIDLKVDRAFNLGPANLRGYVWVQNLLDQEQVVGVYRTTGLPDDDGFIETDPDVIANLDTDLQRDSYRFLYGEYTGGPVNPGGFKTSGGSFYGLPRRIRLGITLDF